MKTPLTLLFVLFLCGPASALDLPPDILADQYLLEATKALESGDTRGALRAFGKIEALDTEPPLEFAYFYGKLLVESTTTLDDLRKGRSLLQQFVLSIEKESEHYTSTLELLSVAEGKLAEAEAERQGQAEIKARAEAERQRQAEIKARLPLLLAQVNAQMVHVPGGTFTMGCSREQSDCSDNEKPAHQVRVSDFEIGKYEVTQELWEAVMGSNPSHFSGCVQCPVGGVSWDDIQEFLGKLNAGGERYRLPSEAEWEYAARGGRQSRGYKYAGGTSPGAVAWYSRNSGGKTHPVGQKQANELGLHDLSGNVSEWVQDCWNYGYQGAPSDGQAWERGDCRRRVLRGGSWHFLPGFLRSASRYRGTTVIRGLSYGFRLVRTPP